MQSSRRFHHILGQQTRYLALASSGFRIRPTAGGHLQQSRYLSSVGYASNIFQCNAYPGGSRESCIHPSRSFSSKSAFVSKHFRLGQGEVEAFLRRHRLTFRISGEHAVVEVCPFCHPTHDRIDNHYKLYVWRDAGNFFCHRCQAKGSWFDLRKRLSSVDHTAEGVSLHPVSSTVGPNSSYSKNEGNISVFPSEKSQEEYEQNLESKNFRFACQHLNKVRMLSMNTLKKYGVGAGYFNVSIDGNVARNEPCFTFPMYDGERRLVRHKLRSVNSKKGMRLAPKGGMWGFFGLNTVPGDSESVILTEGEYDAMSVYEATGKPAISLPNGASSLPVSLLPFLERFKQIYLWMDDDAAGQRGTDMFSRKLGEKRCLIVRNRSKDTILVKDANDALQKGVDLSVLLENAEVIPHNAILRFEDIRGKVLADIMNQGEQGMKSISLPKLQPVRPGELTIMTGHTGVGKTTFLSQISLDYAMQGMRTLWASLEIPYDRLASRMLQQFHAICNQGPHSLIDDFDKWADQFSELPIYFLKFHGSCPIEQVVDAMEYANYVHDCSYVLVDNLQFMSYAQGAGSLADRMEVMDHAVAQLRDFSTSRKAHVVVVVHPRKVNDGENIQLASVFGSAKATQDADNVVVLQRGENSRILEVLKNRFDGKLGTVDLRFDSKRFLYYQLSGSSAWVEKNLQNTSTSEGAYSQGKYSHGTYGTKKVRKTRSLEKWREKLIEHMRDTPSDSNVSKELDKKAVSIFGERTGKNSVSKSESSLARNSKESKQAQQLGDNG